MKFDMHCHTKEGSIDGKLPLEDTILRLRSLGYGGMLITDHNSYKAHRFYQKTLAKKYPDFVVLKGIEYDTLDAGHILVILPTGVHIPVLELRGLPVSLLIDIVHHYGGILGPAHPCGEKYLSITNTKRGHKNHNILKRFDFIETFNACESPESNKAAAALAARLNKPGVGGSDSHRYNCVGLGYAELPDTIRTETDLVRYILTASDTVTGGEYYTHTAKQKIGRLNDVLVYSFWFYNKLSAAYRMRARYTELHKISA